MEHLCKIWINMPFVVKSSVYLNAFIGYKNAQKYNLYRLSKLKPIKLYYTTE